MSFPIAISSSQVDYLSTMQFATDCYLLVWSQNIVFRARINQESFSNTYAFISYDTPVGNFVDAKEGYTIWISKTDNIRESKWWGRLRDDTVDGVFSVEWNSYAAEDDDYIFVTKDVRESTKTPRLVSDSWLSDYAISYHTPRPIIYGIPTYNFGVIDSNGNADITVTPGAYAIASGAAISTWTLDTDGGTQVSFSAATGAAVIRYTTPGDYMPRWTVTDSNGISQWFTPFVTIAPADLSSVVKLNFNDISFSADNDGGWNMTMPFWDGVQNTLDGSMCAVYLPHATAGNKILMCGRIRSEDSDYTINGRGTASFIIDGLTETMNNLDVITWRYKDVAAPADFDEIENLTLWRAIGAYIGENTNINNTHSLQFDETTDDYRYLSYFFQNGTLLDSLKDQMWSINYDFDFSSDGMMRMNRNLRYQTEAERNALTHVAHFTFDNFKNSSNDGVGYSLVHSHSLRVGRIIMGCGWYETTGKNVTPFSAISPPIQPGRGIEQAVTDRQIMKANLSATAAKTEGKRRVRDDFSAKQVLDTLNSIRINGAFLGKINPSISDYYTFDITVNDGIRDISFDSGDKFLLTNLDTVYNKQTGQIELSPTWQIESEDLGFSISIRDPLPVTPYNVPVQMPLAAFPTFSPSPGINSPTGAQDGDEQPVDKEDVQDVDAAQDPSTMIVYNETTLLAWNATDVNLTTEFGRVNPNWIDATPAGIPAAHDIYQTIWSRVEASGEGAYCVTNNDDLTGSPETYVYHSKSIRGLASWQSTLLTDLIATMVNEDGVADSAIIYGKNIDFTPAGGMPISGLVFYGGTDDMSGDGEADLLSSDLKTPRDGIVAYSAPGIYHDVVGEEWFDSVNSTSVGAACTIQYNIPAGLTLDKVSLRATGHSGGVNGFNDGFEMSVDGTIHLTSAGFSAVVTSTITVSHTFAPPLQNGAILLINCCTRWNDGTDDGFCKIDGVQIEGTIETDFCSTRYTDNLGASFDPLRGVGVLTLGDGSFSRRMGGTIMAASDGQVKRTAVTTGNYGNADQGSTPGQFAAALYKMNNDDYLFAPDGGAVGLYRVQSDVMDDISPNDGSVGVIASVGGIAMSNTSKDIAYVLMDFAGTKKVAYTTNLRDGTPTWNYTVGFSVDANWISCNPRDPNVVYVGDGAHIWRSINGAVVFTQYNSPISSLIGIEAL